MDRKEKFYIEKANGTRTQETEWKKFSKLKMWTYFTDKKRLKNVWENVSKIRYLEVYAKVSPETTDKIKDKDKSTISID